MDTEMLMCPKYQRGLPPASTRPEFNCDQLYYTSAFLTGVEKRELELSSKEELIEHQRLVRECGEKNIKAEFPRPRSKHTHCSVCKVHYQDYYNHILSEGHKDNIHNSEYNYHLLNLTEIFQSLHPFDLDLLPPPYKFPVVKKKNNDSAETQAREKSKEGKGVKGQTKTTRL